MPFSTRVSFDDGGVEEGIEILGSVSRRSHEKAIER